MSKYKEMLTIPLESGLNIPLFLTAPNFVISNGYNRVVIGQRGPYVEFNKNQIFLDYSPRLWIKYKAGILS